MNFNTLKTVVGYFYSLIEPFMPLRLSGNSPQAVYNYLRIDDRLSTSGQPTRAQFKSIRDAGFEQVINLAPHSAENALADEPACLAALGLPYLHIPVDFSCPTDEDFQQFSAAMQNFSEKKLWLHCAANMRVSAFVYRYRIAVLGEQRELAEADLKKIWKPFGVWRKFIDKVAV